MSYGMNGWNKEIPGGDLISREAAIDELDKGAWGVEWDKTLAKTMIESLPSAQPTQNTRVNSNNSLDTISREAALEALDEINAEVEDGDGFQYEKWRVHFRVLPSAQPERKRGKWVYAEDKYGVDGYHCNQCGFFVPWDYTHKFINYIEDYHFCPQCGADMREVDDHETD